MASLDLIYISSDDEKDSSKKIKLKGHRPQHHASRVGARAKSVDPTGKPPMRVIKRSNSAPSKVSFASTPLSRSDPTSKERSNSATSPGTQARTSISQKDTRANQITLSTPSLDPPIEPLHFPERYGLGPPYGETNTSVDSGTKGSESRPTNTSAEMNRPNDHKLPSSPNRSESLPAGPAANKPEISLNPLKRKHDHPATEPPKRPRTATPTYIPRHLPYHPPMGAAQKPAPRSHAPYYSLPSAPAHPLLPVSNPTLWATPAYDPNMDRNVADGANSPFAPLPLPAAAEMPGHSPQIATEQQQQQPDPPPKPRKRQWNCGMLSDLATSLQKTFDAQSFSTKHNIDMKEVLKVFAIYVHQPLSAFSARGLSRAKMKEFKEKMKEHDRKVKEAAAAAGDEAAASGAAGGGRRRGRKTPVDHVKPRQRKESQPQTPPGKSGATTPQLAERRQSNAVSMNVPSAVH